MKKGLTYIDVAISVGIFVIYALFLFITFRPAIQEEYDDDYLISIVQTNFIRDTYWSQSRIPIAITPADDVSGKAVTITFPFTWRENSVYLTNSEGVEKNIEITSSSLTIESIGAWTPPDKKQFFAYHSDEFSYYAHTSLMGDRMTISDELVFIGVAEINQGIQRFSQSIQDKDKFSLLLETPYEELKEKWNYPKKKDFFIDIETPDGTSKGAIGTNPDTLTINTKINRLTFSSRFLDEMGGSSQAVIDIRTW